MYNLTKREFKKEIREYFNLMVEFKITYKQLEEMIESGCVFVNNESGEWKLSIEDVKRYKIINEYATEFNLVCYKLFEGDQEFTEFVWSHLTFTKKYSKTFNFEPFYL